MSFNENPRVPAKLFLLSSWSAYVPLSVLTMDRTPVWLMGLQQDGKVHSGENGRSREYMSTENYPGIRSLA